MANQGIFHNVFNPNGSRKCSDGNFFYNTSVSINSTADCFNSSKWLTASGSISSAVSARPDGKFYDAIYEADVLDLRNSAHKPLDLQRLLEREFNRLVAGETRGWENAKNIVEYVAGTNISAKGFSGTADCTYVGGTGTGIFSDEYLGGDEELIGYVWSDVDSIFYRISSTVINPIGYDYVYLLDSYGDLSAKFTIGQPFKVIWFKDSDIQTKTLLQCDIIGDPANYYRGHYDFVSSDGVQTVVAGTTVVKIDTLNTGTGTIGNFYQSNAATGSLDLDDIDYTVTAQWTDLGADRADSWITNGVMGTPLLVGETGGNLIPDGTSKTYKATRKVSDVKLNIYSDDNGVTWTAITSWDANLEGATNAHTVTQPTGRIFMLFYETETSPFENADNDEVLALGDVWAGNYYNYSSAMINALIGKTPVATVGKSTAEGYKVSGYSLTQLTNILRTYAETQPQHDAVYMYDSANPACKVLPYLTRENSKLFLQMVFKEMIYDTDWGDDSKFNIVSDVSTTTDDNANTILIGQKRLELPFFIGDGE